ncbi:MAG: XdhC family protein [Parvularculaceae bacterium]
MPQDTLAGMSNRAETSKEMQLSTVGTDHDDVLPVLHDWLQRGRAAALVTLVNIEGSAPRPLGAQMAVAADGAFAGYITGGCAEAAVAEEARKAIREGSNRTVRYGAGSPFVDIRLPCGSGIDVYIDAAPDADAVGRIVETIRARRPAAMLIDTERHKTTAIAPDETEQEPASAFLRLYEPATRLLAIGKGPVFTALAQLASAAGFEVAAMSPEQDRLAALESVCAHLKPMKRPGESFPAELDAWTAAALLFHEHEWEPPALEMLLESDCFYIGALGSKRTHAERCALLAERGVTQKALSRIRGPIGFDIGAKSPEEIAVATLAEVVAARRAAPAPEAQ